MRREFVLLKTMRQPLEVIAAAVAQAGQPLAFSTVANRRMRYWTDGLVIGSKAFVVQIMTAARGAEHMGKRRLTAALEEGAGALRLTCYKRLRQFAT